MCHLPFGRQGKAAYFHRQQGHALACFNIVCEEIHQRLVAHVHQGRVQQIAVLLQAKGHFQFGIQASTLNLRGLQTLKGSTVVQAQGVRQTIVSFTINLQFRRTQGCQLRLGHAFIRGQNAATGVHHPFVLAQALTALDMEAAIARAQHKTQAAGMFTVKNQRRQNIQLVHQDPRFAQPLAGCGQSHLQISGARVHHGSAHFVIGQPRQNHWVQYVFPADIAIWQTPTQQIMHTAAFDGTHSFRAVLVPMTLTLPRIHGQIHRITRHGETGFQLGRQQGQGMQSRIGQTLRAIIMLAQAGQHNTLYITLSQGFTHIALQNGVRANFQKDATTLFGQAGNGLLKLHGFANIAPPVVHAQLLRGQFLTSNSRNKTGL